MALVTYDYSDSSDVDVEDDNATVGTVLPIRTEEALALPKPEMQIFQLGVQNIKTEDILECVEANSSQSLFGLLPQPSLKKPSVEEDDDEFLHKKESLSNIVKPKAKIMVPSLSDFKDVEPSKPSAKPKILNGKKSGLLSILPQPRNALSATTRSFVPHMLTQKPTTTVKKKPLPSPMKIIKTDVKSQDYSDDSDDGEMQNDFFSINKGDDTPIEDMPLDIDLELKQVKSVKTERKPHNLQSYFKQDVPESHVESSNFKEDTETQYGNLNGSTSHYANKYEAGSSNSSQEVVLDDEAILKLCGTRGKRKGEDIQIVDVNQKEVLGDARDWLLKGLMDDTTKRVSVSKRRNEPTSQQRRKHQITYLAHQAKANEADLQNQWANNKMTKRQTQSKYGF